MIIGRAFAWFFCCRVMPAQGICLGSEAVSERCVHLQPFLFYLNIGGKK
jgi:hypothetical protein